MINQDMIQGNWTTIRGKLREKWSQLTDSDLGEFQGDVEQLVGRIQARTGESRERIEHYLSEMGDQANDFVHETADRARDAASSLNQMIADGYNEAEDMIRNRPGQAVAIALGLGIAAGLGIAILLNDRPHRSTASRARDGAEHLGRHLLEALKSALPEAMSDRIRSL